jgi:ketosteroid isomerase-like protein
MKILSLALIGVCLLAACKQQPDTRDEEARLLATDIEFSKKSVEAGAAEAFHAFLAEDAVQFMANAGPVTGNENIYNLMKGGTSILRWEPKKAEVCRSGEMGYTWGFYTLQPGPETGGPVRYGKYVNVWRKGPGGLWKVIIDIGNSGPSPDSTSIQH